MFAVPFAEIGEVISRSPEATRQLASRARRRVRGAVPQEDADLAKQREAVDAFLAAARAGDFDALVAVLDPNVVLRAAGARELQRELRGAADVAHSMATFGPRFATLCHPATVNGRPGLLVTARRGAAGAVGFTVCRGVIATIDLTIDLDRLEAGADAHDGGLAHGGEAAGESGLLSYIRGSRGAVAERIIAEALSWPGVTRSDGEFGSVMLCVGRRELGHLHGDAVADVPLPPEPAAPSVDDAAAGERDSGWVRIPLDTEEGVQQTLALLHSNYELPIGFGGCPADE
jgi:hypothetical protein